MDPITPDQIEIKPARKSGYYLQVVSGARSTLIHSRYDPISEASRWVEEREGEGGLVLIGGGLGYVPRELLEQGRDVWVIEPLPALDPPPGTPLFELSERDLYCNLNVEGLDEWVEGLPPERVSGASILVHPGYEQLLGDPEPLRQNLKRRFRGRMRDVQTRHSFFWTWFDNLLRILPELGKTYSLSSLNGQFEDIPCVIAGAGPSLEDDVEWLSEIASDVVLIAVDSAVLPLQKAGIEPTFVITLDPQASNASLLQNVMPGPSLVGSWSARPEYFEWSRQERRFPMYISRDVGGERPMFPLSTWLKQDVKGIGSLQTGGSAASTGLDLAQYLGCDPIGLVGVDHAYTHHRAVCRGSAWEENQLRRLNRFRTMAGAHLEKIFQENRRRGKDVFQTKTREGRTVYTTEEYQQQNRWFERAGRDLPRRCLDLRSDGLPMKHWDPDVDPEDVTGGGSPKSVFPDRNELEPLRVDWGSLRSRTSELLTRVRSISSHRELETDPGEQGGELVDLFEPFRHYQALHGEGTLESTFEEFRAQLLDRLSRLRTTAEEKERGGK